MPEWYTVIRAARYLGVAPWDLAVQAAAWTDYALMAEAAEKGAEAYRQWRARSDQAFYGGM